MASLKGGTLDSARRISCWGLHIVVEQSFFFWFFSFSVCFKKCCSNVFEQHFQRKNIFTCAKASNFEPHWRMSQMPLSLEVICPQCKTIHTDSCAHSLPVASSSSLPSSSPSLPSSSSTLPVSNLEIEAAPLFDRPFPFFSPEINAVPYSKNAHRVQLIEILQREEATVGYEHWKLLIESSPSTRNWYSVDILKQNNAWTKRIEKYERHSSRLRSVFFVGFTEFNQGMVDLIAIKILEGFARNKDINCQRFLWLMSAYLTRKTFSDLCRFIPVAKWRETHVINVPFALKTAIARHIAFESFYGVSQRTLQERLPSQSLWESYFLESSWASILPPKTAHRAAISVLTSRSALPTSVSASIVASSFPQTVEHVDPFYFGDCLIRDRCYLRPGSLSFDFALWFETVFQESMTDPQVLQLRCFLEDNFLTELCTLLQLDVDDFKGLHLSIATVNEFLENLIPLKADISMHGIGGNYALLDDRFAVLIAEAPGDSTLSPVGNIVLIQGNQILQLTNLGNLWEWATVPLYENLAFSYFIGMTEFESRSVLFIANALSFLFPAVSSITSLFRQDRLFVPLLICLYLTNEDPNDFAIENFKPSRTMIERFCKLMLSQGHQPAAAVMRQVRSQFGGDWAEYFQVLIMS